MGTREILYFEYFFENLSRKYKFRLILARTASTLHAYLRTWTIICRWILLRMTNVSDKYCRENQNTHFIFSNFFRKSWRFWENVEKYCRVGQATEENVIQRMRFTFWKTKATDTGTADGDTVVKVLCYKSEGRWFDSGWCHWNFSLT
jgi:hypothetical protein